MSRPRPIERVGERIEKIESGASKGTHAEQKTTAVGYHVLCVSRGMRKHANQKILEGQGSAKAFRDEETTTCPRQLHQHHHVYLHHRRLHCTHRLPLHLIKGITHTSWTVHARHLGFSSRTPSTRLAAAHVCPCIASLKPPRSVRLPYLIAEISYDELTLFSDRREKADICRRASRCRLDFGRCSGWADDMVVKLLTNVGLSPLLLYALILSSGLLDSSLMQERIMWEHASYLVQHLVYCLYWR